MLLLVQDACACRQSEDYPLSPAHQRPEWARSRNTDQGLERRSVPGPGQCFGYVPILGAGGPEVVDNLQIVDMRTHLELITALMGPLDRFVFDN